MNEKRIKYLNNTLGEQIAARQRQQEENLRAEQQIAQRQNTDRLSYTARQMETSTHNIKRKEDLRLAKTQEQNRKRDHLKEDQRLDLLQRMNDKRRNARLSA